MMNAFSKPFPRRVAARLPLAAAICALTWAGTATAQSGSGMSSEYQSESQQRQSQGQQSQGSAQSAMGAQAGQSAQGSQSLAQQLPDSYKLSNWIGKDVRNNAGDKLGTVKELVMDDFGIVRYAIIKSEVLGPEKQDQLVAVPMGHFKYPLTQQDHLVFDTSPQQIQGAPTFAESQWPNMGDPGWSSLIITYWVPEEQLAAAQREQGQAGQAAQGAQAGAQGMQGMPQSMQQRMQQIHAGVPGFQGAETAYLSPQQQQAFKRLDQDSDGVIDRQEARGNQQLSQQFERIDTYGNDRITRAEFSAFEVKESQSQQGAQQEAQQGMQQRMQEQMQQQTPGTQYR